MWGCETGRNVWCSKQRPWGTSDWQYAVNSIWSPLTRRRWWNGMGDDTAFCGITSTMIRCQPDHPNSPSPYPFQSKSFLLPIRHPPQVARRTRVLCGRQANECTVGSKCLVLCDVEKHHGQLIGMHFTHAISLFCQEVVTTHEKNRVNT